MAVGVTAAAARRTRGYGLPHQSADWFAMTAAWRLEAQGGLWAGTAPRLRRGEGAKKESPEGFPFFAVY